MRKITLIICAAMMIASTLRAQEVKSIEASIEDYIALLNQNGYQAYSFDISLMKDATYQIQFEVREYVAGNPEPVSAQPYGRGFKSRTMVSDFMWRELSEEELADIRDASVDYENGVYSRAEKITVGFLPCENDSTEVGRLFVENQGSSGFSLKLKPINCKTQFIDINPNEDIYIHNGVYANEAIFNKVAAEDPEAVIMVGYLKNDKEVRVVVTPSEVYVTGIVILREQSVRFIPASEPVGDLEEYERFKLYNESRHGKKITYVDYLNIPSENLGYLFVEKRNDKKYLHVYTTDYNTIVHLSKCKKTRDINDENLSWVNEKTQILVDGKWDNYEGYLRTLKFRSDRILEIEYHKYSDKKVKKQNLANNGFVSVIFNKEYSDEITLVM